MDCAASWGFMGVLWPEGEKNSVFKVNDAVKFYPLKQIYSLIYSDYLVFEEK